MYVQIAGSTMIRINESLLGLALMQQGRSLLVALPRTGPMTSEA
jgi:hypothetical protein